MEREKSKSPAPPYVAYKTLVNVLDRYRQIVPGRIDSRMLGNSLSGGVRGQIIAALKSLRLISDSGVPSEAMKGLCISEGAPRQAALRQVIIEAYPFVFGDGFDLSNATASQLRELFEENTSATGETVTRCMAFLKEASIDAGIPVSPFLNDQKGRTATSRKKPAKKSSPVIQDNAAVPPSATHSTPTVGTINARESLLLWGLFQRLPKPGTVWPKAEREQWTNTLNNVLTLEYKEHST